MLDNTTYSELYFIIPALILLISNILSWNRSALKVSNNISIFVIILVILFSFYRVNIPSDYLTYEDVYLNGFDSKFSEHIEPLWVLITNNIYKSFNLDFGIFCFFIIIFSLIIKIKFYKKNGLEYAQFFYYYYISFWLLLDLGALRRSLTITLIFLILLLPRFILASGIILIIAFLFHISAIFSIPLLLIYFYNNFTNRSYILFYISILFSILFINVGFDIFDLLYPGRLNALIGTGYGKSVNILTPGFILRFLICLYIFINIIKNKNVSKIEKCYILYVPFYLFGLVIEPLSFAAFYPRIFEPIVFNNIMKMCPIYLRIIVLIILLSMITILFNPIFMNEYLVDPLM